MSKNLGFYIWKQRSVEWSLNIKLTFSEINLGRGFFQHECRLWAEYVLKESQYMYNNLTHIHPRIIFTCHCWSDRPLNNSVQHFLPFLIMDFLLASWGWAQNIWDFLEHVYDVQGLLNGSCTFNEDMLSVKNRLTLRYLTAKRNVFV